MGGFKDSKRVRTLRDGHSIENDPHQVRFQLEARGPRVIPHRLLSGSWDLAGHGEALGSLTGPVVGRRKPNGRRFMGSPGEGVSLLSMEYPMPMLQMDDAISIDWYKWMTDADARLRTLAECGV